MTVIAANQAADVVKSKSMKLTPIEDKQSREPIINLLKENALPVDDIGDNTLLFGFLNDDELSGSAGLEVFEDCALIRSISIQKKLQGKGYGVMLQKELEQIALSRNIRCLYLLTTTAEGFFKKQGFMTIQRDEVPASIRATSEFSSVCPSSAIVMKKILVNE